MVEEIAAQVGNALAIDTDQLPPPVAPTTQQPPPWARLTFPDHWDAYLRLVTQATFQNGFSNPAFFSASVRDATLYLETRLRDLCDAPNSEIGIDLVSYAFKHDSLDGYLLNPSIVPAEAQGIHALFRGAVLQIRNPVGHRYVNLPAVQVFDIIALINYLLSTAQDLAQQKFIYPFLPTQNVWRNVLGTRRVDVNTDGRAEIIVLFNEGSSEHQPKGGVLVLQEDATQALKGDIPRLDGYFSPLVVTGDVDGDLRDEVLVSFYGENQLAYGVLIDFDAQADSVRAISELDGAPLTSYVQPFEIKADGRIVAYGGDGRPKIARLDGNQLVGL